MAVVENAGGNVDLGVKVGSAGGRSLVSADSPPESGVPNKDADRQQTSPVLSPTMQQHAQPKQQSPVAVARLGDAGVPNGAAVQRAHFDRNAFRAKVQQRQLQAGGQGLGQAPAAEQGVPGGGVNVMASEAQPSNGEGVGRDGEGAGEGFRRDIRDLEELLSKLNPMAEEFVPSSLVNHQGSDGGDSGGGGGEYVNDFGTQHHTLGNGNGSANGHGGRRKKSNFGQGKRRMNSRTSMAQREEVIRRTVYVSDIDQQVTEEQLAALFINCGQVVDCRVCGDPNSVLRFAFIEFTDEDSARAALSLSGTMLGYYPVRVLPSKTAIAPVNPSFLPRSEVEREMCARTIYCTNIDKRVSQASVKLFFESICGEVHRLRLLGDYHHSTRIAFVEFVMVCILGPSAETFILSSAAESAIAALNCSGAILGSLPIRLQFVHVHLGHRCIEPCCSK
ncbi:hypothetical protein Taro_037030, partial [Colocasia esculenta]|nr:hypothetical protein [Colocasia esculenta]